MSADQKQVCMSENNLLENFLNKCLTFNDKKIRTAGTFDDPWFCGKDVASILGYVDHINAIKLHVKNKHKSKYADLHKIMDGDLPYTLLNTIYINEAGLYSLIFSSKLKIADQFRDWIFEDVIPSIRKNGSFHLHKKIEELERKQLILHDHIACIEELKRDQVFYIATSPAYAAQNRFEFGGGVAEEKDLKTRINKYNTGRAEGDLFYYAKTFKCHKYKNIEELLHTLLAHFKDKKSARKEMVHMHYHAFCEVIEFVVENYDRGVEFINNNCKKWLDWTLDSEPFIPEPIDLKYISVQVSHMGRTKTQKINVTDWTQEQIQQKIKEIFNLCAREKYNLEEYNLDEKINTVPLNVEWATLAKYFDTTGISRTQWKNIIRQFFRNIGGPGLIKVKGLPIAA